jgi:V/A-type H+-transporting ATPase subunit B
MMDLSVNISLEEALDQGWQILAECFKPEETGIRTDLIKKFWPTSQQKDELSIAERNRVAELIPS